jgi:RNA polymerase sigma-70 factor, ECF subfamily
MTGDLQLAEDVVQEACVAALTQWQRDAPANPGGWLVGTARHKALDRLRRETTRAAKERLAAAPPVVEPPDLNCDDLVDDQLALIFMCCHPALEVEARLALTLRCVAGMKTDDIAGLFLVAAATAAQRLVRAKRKIARARIPFSCPTPGDFPARLDDVLRVIALLFTHGHRDSREAAARSEAIRLARLVAALLPHEPEATALVALLLFVDARQGSRLDADGLIVTLDRQDRTAWNHAAIAEADALLDQALRANQPGPIQLQAAIAALHSTAATAEETDWAQIALLYSELLRYDPSPVIEANRAVAVAMAERPASGLVILDVIANEPHLARWAPFHMTRGELLGKLDRRSEAVDAYRTALQLDPSEPERALIETRLAELRGSQGGERA